MDHEKRPARWDRLLVHYAEIGLKGANRPYFERKLRQNLDGALSGLGVSPMRKEQGRFTAAIGPEADVAAVLTRAAQVPGVAWFAPVRSVESDFDTIRDTVLEMAVPHPPETFRLTARRCDKSFPKNSLEINREIGAAVVQATGRRVSLDHAVYRYGVEVDRKQTYVWWDRREGLGGLPVGCEGELIALLSGGIDSPVAAFRMMVRGCRVQLVHFLNRSLNTNQVRAKIVALAERLALFHGPLGLTIVPFDELQREIVMVVPADYRMIVYRRAMLRIAAAIRAERRALGFVTGDSVGQVASQTLENLHVVHAAADYPVYSPLCGWSKVEITAEARRIGTFETSILPHDDCCSFLVAKHPETRAKLADIEASEVFDVEAGTAAALAGREELTFDPRPEA